MRCKYYLFLLSLHRKDIMTSEKGTGPETPPVQDWKWELHVYLPLFFKQGLYNYNNLLRIEYIYVLVSFTHL